MISYAPMQEQAMPHDPPGSHPEPRPETQPQAEGVTLRPNALLAARRAAGIFGVSLAMLAVYLTLRAVRRDPAARLRLAAEWTRRWTQRMARFCGLRVSSEGPLPPPGALLVPNHCGYTDVLVLGTLLRCFFAPKAEAAHWPLIGPLIRVGEQVTIVRRGGRAVLDAAAQIAARLELGERVCLFLEGTSSGGGVLPFKPSLLEPAMRLHSPIVPVAIHYRALDPAARVAEDVAYWKPDHTLGPHLWRLLGLRGGVEARVHFAPPIAPAPGESRRELADRLEAQVRELYAGLEASASSAASLSARSGAA